ARGAHAVQPVFDYHCARRQQHWVNGCKVIILSLEGNECGQQNQVAVAERTVFFSSTNQQPTETDQPNQRDHGVHKDPLLGKVLDRPEHYVLVTVLYVLKQLQSRKMVPRLPNDVGQEERKGNGAAKPRPWSDELPPMPRQQQAGNDGHGEKNCRV